MLRDIDLDKISDGRLYTHSDLVKADNGGCKGCSSCCRGMGTSIILDPLDVHRLTTHLKLPFEALLAQHLELNVVDGLILPNIKMSDKEDACYFLNKNGRCSIHAFRPGFCRLFPLGRLYENGSFQYFLQVHECPKPGKTKVKVQKWLNEPDIKNYEKFINDWHYFLKGLQEYVSVCSDDALIKQISMYILQQFYLAPFSDAAASDLVQDDPENTRETFYQIFQKRLETAKAALPH